MTDVDLLDEFLAHARDEVPRESCGVVIVWKGRLRYVRCRNLAHGSENFHLHPEDYAAAEEEGEIIAIVHSHPTTNPQPSQADLVGCESTELPWIIVNPATGAWHRFEPSGYKAPFVGRVFAIGTLDCFSLVRDYYKEVLSIHIPDFPRTEDFWVRGEELYERYYQEGGFVKVPQESLRLHDVIVMRLTANCANHAAIYIGDGRILHHAQTRLSGRDVYGGYWQHITAWVGRHKDLL